MQELPQNISQTPRLGLPTLNVSFTQYFSDAEKKVLRLLSLSKEPVTAVDVLNLLMTFRPVEPGECGLSIRWARSLVESPMRKELLSDFYAEFSEFHDELVKRSQLALRLDSLNSLHANAAELTLTANRTRSGTVFIKDQDFRQCFTQLTLRIREIQSRLETALNNYEKMHCENIDAPQIKKFKKACYFFALVGTLLTIVAIKSSSNVSGIVGLLTAVAGCGSAALNKYIKDAVIEECSMIAFDKQAIAKLSTAGNFIGLLLHDSEKQK